MTKANRPKLETLAEQLANLTVLEVERLGQVIRTEWPGLVDRLKDLLRRDGQEKKEQPHDIMELEGLGADFWRSIDVEEYIRQERASWR